MSYMPPRIASFTLSSVGGELCSPCPVQCIHPFHPSDPLRDSLASSFQLARCYSVPALLTVHLPLEAKQKELRRHFIADLREAKFGVIAI